MVHDICVKIMEQVKADRAQGAQVVVRVRIGEGEGQILRLVR